MKRSNYFKGKCRKVYKLNESLDQSLLESDISIIKSVCSSYVSSLAQIANGSQAAKTSWNRVKKKIKRRLQEPKDPDRDHYRNVSMQNEWIEATFLTQWVITSFVQVHHQSAKCNPATLVQAT